MQPRTVPTVLSKVGCTLADDRVLICLCSHFLVLFLHVTPPALLTLSVCLPVKEGSKTQNCLVRPLTSTSWPQIQLQL